MESDIISGDKFLSYQPWQTFVDINSQGWYKRALTLHNDKRWLHKAGVLVGELLQVLEHSLFKKPT